MLTIFLTEGKAHSSESPEEQESFFALPLSLKLLPHRGSHKDTKVDHAVPLLKDYLSHPTLG
jgi:hypothetical protein